MRLLNFGSGSSGNVTYIGSDRTHLLVDAGLSKKRILEGLAAADLGPEDISGILVTHEHIDHIKGLGVWERFREVPVYTTADTIAAIRRNASLGCYPADVFREIPKETSFVIGDIKVEAYGISHDAADPVCYRFWEDGKSAAIVTDLGCYDEALLQRLEGLDILMAESNHDVRMLEVGPYPYPTKQRILGDRGHLSNEASGRLISRLLHDKMSKIVLAHLSRENNTADLALWTAHNEIDAGETPYKSGDFDIRTAYHDRCSGILEV